MAGKFRYMDSREDEQIHGITMKSSSILLNFDYDSTNYIINVIDSPGHVDFSSEVSCAVRICDGTIVLIDAVEGVCPQTEVVLRQSWIEGIIPCLAINKMDRLLHEIKMSPTDAYIHISKIIEEANSIMACLYKETQAKYIEYNEDKVYFSPVKGNVIFCSAYIGWGFRIENFSRYFKEKLKIPDDKFEESFWGDFYYDFKQKKVFQNANSRKKKQIFVQFVLENIWSVYAVFLGPDASIESQTKIISKIDESLLSSIAKISNPIEKYSFFMKKWLPLVDSLMRMVVEKLPSPLNLSNRRVVNLLSSSLIKYKDLPESSKELKYDFFKCCCSPESPVIIFVSKMIYYEARDVHRACKITKNDKKCNFIAFSRIFSGTIKPGMTLYILTPKFIPGQAQDQTYYKEFIVEELYLMMGKDLIMVDHVPPGNIFGIGGLDEIIYKSATISSTLDCPSFSAINFEVNPIFSVAIEPLKLSDYDRLVESLEILNLSDPILKYSQTETGEHVLSIVGEVHLMKCIKDLEEHVGYVCFSVSSPITPFRETVGPLIATHKHFPSFMKSFIVPSDYIISYDMNILTIRTTDQQINLQMRVEHLGHELVEFLEQNTDQIKKIQKNRNNPIPDSFMNQLKHLLDQQEHLKLKIDVIESILCFSTGLCTNILVYNGSDDLIIKNWFSKSLTNDADGNLDVPLCCGMQMACVSGPLMCETVSGVCFIIENISFRSQSVNEAICDLKTSGQVVSLTKQACLSTMILSNRARCSLPVYHCTVRTNVKVLGAVYGVLNNRYARISEENQIEGTSVFVVTSMIPAPEIIGLSKEMRSKTSGAAQMQLLFSHWETMPNDPFLDETENLNIKTMIPSKIVKQYIYSTRKRKGLKIDEKLIINSEKQRTNKRNK
ncbi:hypothetical protein MXB_4998 [Myxobolus squamalis]|nr:hypothetical protein MXB_4998 [Myxobolus squamalis]